MTELLLKRANEIREKIQKLEAAQSDNFSINIGNWKLQETDISPESAAKIKRILIEEKETLEKEFESL
jgi:hypothetical protein